MNEEKGQENGSSAPCSSNTSECVPPVTTATTNSSSSSRNSSGLYTSSMLPRGGSRSNGSSETRRSTVKELIERYFYQLQRGCGNTFCTNEACASSGLLTPMTPNEAAAKALQLFSQDAPFCDSHNQAPKALACVQSSGQPASSRTISHHQNSEALAAIQTNSINNSNSTNDQHAAANTSGNSSRRLQDADGSNMPARSTDTTTSSSSRQSGGRNMTSRSLLPFLHELDETILLSATSPDSQQSRLLDDEEDYINECAATGERIVKFLYDSDSSPERHSKSKQKENEAAAAAAKEVEDSGSDSASVMYTRFPPVHFLNENIVDELIAKGNKDGNYEQLLNAIAEVYSCVDKLSQSFRRPTKIELNQVASSTTTATKLYEILGKSACDLKKEDLRSLEGETEKDEDSSCAAAAAAVPLPPSMDIEEVANLTASATAATATEPPTTDSTKNVRDRDDISMSDDTDDDDCTTNVVASRSCKSSKDFVHLKNTSDMLVDLESLRRVKKKLFALNETSIAETLNGNIIVLSETIKYQYNQWDWEQVLHCIIICFDMITNISNSLMDFEFLERSLPKLCQAVRVMPVTPQARLTRIWSAHCKDQLHSLVQCCQQLISLHVIMNDVAVQENSDVIAATKVLKIAYYASILAGESDPPRNPVLNDVKEESAASTSSLVMQHDDEDEMFVFNTEVPSSQYPRYADDDLAKELNLRAMYCRQPIVPYDEFYNEPLSDNIQMDRDYLFYKKLALDPTGEDANFSFMLYSFILTPATKVVGLYYDSRIRMYSERQTSIYSILSLYNGEPSDLNSTPDLKLKVRRDNIVNDALVGLELAAMGNPKDLKKQLVIEFIGEQGIDEGGVSKEFFQLIVEEIFNIDFGMFVELEETDAFWFNSMSFENDAQFTLIGIIIGLAIYNNIILAVRFPMVVYRKLMGAFATFNDLKDFNPILYRSLQSMLDYEDDDMEDVFMQTFKISYKNVFGEVCEHELKPGGADIAVGQNNKQDFVDLYADFLLNRSIDRQFEAFKKGFEMVTDESPLRLLFRPEEIELLVCGSKKFDFVELEKSTEYEGGYTKETQIVKDFWEIVHSMPEESKRKLLEFTTGSDRVPVGGLSRLKLLITRHGPDCDRLPTSHTCFNILLLPEYSSKEKLEEMLLKAITYSKGFGML